MLTILLATYLLLVMPAKALWDSRLPKPEKAPLPAMQRYWRMTWKPLILMAALVVVSIQDGYTAHQLGLDMPVSQAGLWGILAAVLILAAMVAGSYLSERKMTLQQREEANQKLLDSPIPTPETPLQFAANIASTTILCAAWELLFRGFLLLIMTPYSGLTGAVVISSVAYGLAHGLTNPLQMTMSVVMALLFTGGYALTGSLWWLIILHAGLPLTGLVYAMQARAWQARTEAAR